MTLKLLPSLLAVALPLAFAGCVGTNPQGAFDDVRAAVAARNGESVRWSQDQSSNQEIAAIVQALLHTNLTVRSVTTIALLNNRSLQAEFEEIGISQADLAQASRLQNIELAGSWRFPDRPPSIVDVEYSATGNFLDLLTLSARKKIAVKNLEQAKLQVADKVLQLTADAQVAFYTIQAQTELVKRLEAIVEVNNAGADVAQRLYDAGNINELELHDQQAPSIQSRLDLMKARAGIQRERERLNRLLGLSDEEITWRVADELPPIPKQEEPLENLESLAVNQRLDLAAVRSQEESIAAALRLKKHTRLIPGVAIGVDSEKMPPDGQRVTGPTLDLELPVFDQGQPAIARLTAKYRQARDNYTAREVSVRSEVREARGALLAAREAVEFSQQDLLPLRKEILGETLLQYNAMQKNSFDLLVAKEREQTAEESNIEALRDYWIARVELERAVGGRLTTGSNEATGPQKPTSSDHSP